MSILALIPARSGSKSIKDKNLQVWRGKPLLGHSIEQARAARTVDRVIVSTDSDAYAAIAREYGAEVPFLRPAEFAADTSTDLEVFKHALTWLDTHEAYRPAICVHLRPTYPSRPPELIDTIVRLLEQDPSLDSVRTVVPASETPFKMWYRSADGLVSPVISNERPETYNLPRQSLPRVYWQNACVDVVRTAVILTQGSMTGCRIFGYVMPDNERLDIDTPEDLVRLRMLDRGPIADRRYLTFCFDLDGVIASIVPDNDYHKATCIGPTVQLINRLFGCGHKIVIFTARGSATGLDWRDVTERQLTDWNVHYHELRFGKPAADVYVDDKCMSEQALHTLFDER